MKVLLSLIILFLACCSDSNSRNKTQGVGDRLLEDTEHHINDSPEILKHDSTVLDTGWYYVVDFSNDYKRQLDRSDEVYHLNPKPIITERNFTKLEIYESNSVENKFFGLAIYLDREGTEKWSIATYQAQGNRLAFILDNRLLHVPLVINQITNGVTALNRGVYSRQELEDFKAIIEGEK